MKKLNYFSGVFLALTLSVAQNSMYCQMSDVQVTFTQGDITQSKCAAIVNAANEQLRYGAGVCGAIFDGAGVDLLQAACDSFALLKDNIRCFVGDACITDSFNLGDFGIEKIIHAVGPDCRKITTMEEQDRLLQEVYLNTLQIAGKNNITSIALPFISSGIYGFPRERCCEIALKTIKKYIKNNPRTTIKVIKFVLFSKEDFHLFCKTWKQVL